MDISRKLKIILYSDDKEKLEDYVQIFHICNPQCAEIKRFCFDSPFCLSGILFAALYTFLALRTRNKNTVDVILFT